MFIASNCISHIENFKVKSFYAMRLNNYNISLYTDQIIHIN